MKDFWMEPNQKKVNKKKIAIVSVIAIIIVAIIIAVVLYIQNEPIRDWIDKNILKKEITQNNTTTIELKENQNSNIYAFNHYIGILNKGQFSIYNNTGKQEKEISIDISTPIFNSAGRFLTIAEDKGQQLYLIADKEVSWQAKVDGNISQICVNKNGYVAVNIVDTSYKTVIAMYDPQGKELFKTYLSSTRVADVSISNDNKYLAIAEIDTSGTMIVSDVKIISLEKAQLDSTNSVVKTYKGADNALITNVRYQDKEKLVCMYTDSIHMISSDNDETIVDNNNSKIIFSSIDLNNSVVTVEEKSSGLFTADSVANIVNLDNKNISAHETDYVAKEIYTYEDIIALNLGTEIEFINTSGWLAKRYIANQEITNIVISSNIAGIVYRDKIEIINL